MMNYFVSLTTLCLLVINQHVSCQRSKTIYQKIQQDPQYVRFNALVRSNRVARLNLHFEQLTVFVPENRAIDRFNGELRSDLVFYHMSFEVLPLALLGKKNSLTTVDLEDPPLWITRSGDDIYVNNARILRERSDYVARSRDGSMGKQQVLHMIDEVLNPLIPSPKFSPTAYDFLSNPTSWHLGTPYSVSSFFTKVKEHKLQYIYEQNAGHTFFVPLDSGMDPHKFRLTDKHILLGHVVPFYVLFTRPTPRDFAHETLSNDDYAYMVLSFVEVEGKLYVKGRSRGSDFFSEVVVANIPVKNGVVHLIAKPLGIISRPLKPFPYLPMLQKLGADPELEVFYSMGERTGFNEVFRGSNASFTYLVPGDSSWRKLREGGLEPVEEDLVILRRHLIVAERAYSVEQLVALTKASNYSGVELGTQGGPLRVVVVKIDGDYYLKWHSRFIKFLRPDYECSDGIVHVLSGPLVNLRKRDEDMGETIDTGYGGYWDTFKNAFYRMISLEN